MEAGSCISHFNRELSTRVGVDGRIVLKWTLEK